MKKFLEVLGSCPLFEKVRTEDLDALLGCLGARPQKYGKGEIILQEGERASSIGIVLSGVVQIIQVDYYGNRSIMARLGPSDLFAEAFACAGVAHMPVDVISVDETEILLIDAQRITQTCSMNCGFHNQIVHNLLKVVATKNLVLRQKIEVTSKRSTREKLMTYLLAQAKRAGKSSFAIPYDRQELADYLEVDRSGLSAQISQLRREGVLECRKNRFKLL